MPARSVSSRICSTWPMMLRWVGQSLSSSTSGATRDRRAGAVKDGLDARYGLAASHPGQRRCKPADPPLFLPMSAGLVICGSGVQEPRLGRLGLVLTPGQMPCGPERANHRAAFLLPEGAAEP